MSDPMAPEHILPDATPHSTRGPEIIPPRMALPPARTALAAPPGEDGRPPADAAALRDDIERTRERMSRTLDRIEDRVVRRRDQVWSKATLLDVRRAVTSEPWRNLLIAFAAGYVLAALRD